MGVTNYCYGTECFRNRERLFFLLAPPHALVLFNYPCSICKKEVSKHHKAIQCEGYWYHCNCIGLSETEYDELSVSDDMEMRNNNVFPTLNSSQRVSF